MDHIVDVSVRKTAIQILGWQLLLMDWFKTYISKKTVPGSVKSRNPFPNPSNKFIVISIAHTNWTFNTYLWYLYWELKLIQKLRESHIAKRTISNSKFNIVYNRSGRYISNLTCMIKCTYVLVKIIYRIVQFVYKIDVWPGLINLSFNNWSTFCFLFSFGNQMLRVTCKSCVERRLKKEKKCTSFLIAILGDKIIPQNAYCIRCHNTTSVVTWPNICSIEYIKEKRTVR